MTGLSLLCVLFDTFAVGVSMCDAQDASALPCKQNAPIVAVKRETYWKRPREKAAVCVTVRYVGPGLIREETHAIEAVSDTPEASKRRRSNDDGQTWSAFKSVTDPVTHPQGVRVFWGFGPQVYDDARYLSPTDRKSVAEVIRNRGKTAVWILAPGVVAIGG